MLIGRWLIAPVERRGGAPASCPRPRRRPSDSSRRRRRSSRADRPAQRARRSRSRPGRAAPRPRRADHLVEGRRCGCQPRTSAARSARDEDRRVAGPARPDRVWDRPADDRSAAASTSRTQNPPPLPRLQTSGVAPSGRRRARSPRGRGGGRRRGPRRGCSRGCRCRRGRVVVAEDRHGLAAPSAARRTSGSGGSPGRGPRRCARSRRRR